MTRCAPSAALDLRRRRCGAGARATSTLTPKPPRWLALADPGLAQRAGPRRAVCAASCSVATSRTCGSSSCCTRSLAPAPEESAGRLRDYLRLLPAAPGPVAELAWGQVREARLDQADVAEGIEALTFRPEVKLAVKGLTWLDRELATSPERVVDHVTALANAYAHPSHEVRDRAVTLTLKHAVHLTDPAPILDAAGMLPPASARPIFERFAGGWTGDFTPGRLPRVSVAGPLPGSGPDGGPPEEVGWISVEAWLAAVVREAHTNPASLRDTLASRFGEHLRPVLYDATTWDSPRDWCTALARNSSTRAKTRGRPGPGGSHTGGRSPRSSGLTRSTPSPACPAISDRPLRRHGGRRGHGLPAVPRSAHGRPAARAAGLPPGRRSSGRPTSTTGRHDPSPRPGTGSRRVRESARPHYFLLARLDELLRAAKNGTTAPRPAGHARPRRRPPRPRGPARPPGCHAEAGREPLRST